MPLYYLQTSNKQSYSGTYWGKIEKVWKNIDNFYITCTTADIENPNSIYIVGYTADEEHGEQPESAEKVLARVRKIFGAMALIVGGKE
nr:hypothetical protein [Pedobacter panaciterrae]